MVQPVHIPVMVNEVLDALRVQSGGRYVDCTVGAGGHALSILERSQPGGQLLGLDADPRAIELARSALARFSESVLLVNANFASVQAVCEDRDFVPVHGILIDLGLGSFQIDVAERGFSFQQDAPLDMRVSPQQSMTAADIVNTYEEAELADLIWRLGEEKASRRIARAIVRSRPIDTTARLAAVVASAMEGKRGKIHPATRTFQAIRIAVNSELDNLESVLGQAIRIMGADARLVVISYHSLEDRIVKQFLRRESSGCICPPETPVCVCRHVPSLRLISKSVIVPSREEIRSNPRSRSARMRVAERVLSVEDRRVLLERIRVAVSTSQVGADEPYHSGSVVKRSRRVMRKKVLA